MTRLRILLADDHAVLREGLRLLLDGQPDMEVVGEAGDGHAAWHLALQLRPDIVVMDLALPGMDGVEATRRLKGERPDVKILVLTMHQDAGLLQRALRAGAAGFVLKRSAAHALTHAIRAIAQGELYLDPLLAEGAAARLIREPGLKGLEPRDNLSEREQEVLHLVAAGHTNKEIAAQLGLSAKTVETYKARLMSKLGLHTRAEIVRYAVRRGLLPDE